MSLKSVLGAALGLSIVVGATEARAGETSVALLGGYASELRRAERSSDTSYGWGLGLRVEHRFASGLCFGGAFAGHLGTNARAEDDAGISTYRLVRHAMYLGPEVGWELQTSLLFLRPYVGAGGWFEFDRTVVRNRARNDDDLSPFVMPGLVIGYRATSWNVGLDVRVPVATARPLEDAAPTVFLNVGFLVGRAGG